MFGSLSPAKIRRNYGRRADSYSVRFSLQFRYRTVPVYSSVPDPYVFGLPGSTSGSVSHKYGSGSFPFLIKVLSGLK
jgi:hypothetical protein